MYWLQLFLTCSFALASGSGDHVILYRPGTGANGIGGYDIRSGADRAIAFDYESSGCQDHILLYRPGSGTVRILKNEGGNFRAVYAQGDPGSGIGSYDLKHPGDRIIAFDYDHSGRSDHLVLYRPGTGIIFILKNNRGQFSTVYESFGGIGGYDLQSAVDRVFAFDYKSSGKLDHLALYRPGTGTIWILQNHASVFTPVYLEGDLQELEVMI